MHAHAMHSQKRYIRSRFPMETVVVAAAGIRIRET